MIDEYEVRKQLEHLGDKLSSAQHPSIGERTCIGEAMILLHEYVAPLQRLQQLGCPLNIALRIVEGYFDPSIDSSLADILDRASKQQAFLNFDEGQKSYVNVLPVLVEQVKLQLNVIKGLKNELESTINEREMWIQSNTLLYDRYIPIENLMDDYNLNADQISEIVRGVIEICATESQS